VLDAPGAEKGMADQAWTRSAMLWWIAMAAVRLVSGRLVPAHSALRKTCGISAIGTSGVVLKSATAPLATITAVQDIPASLLGNSATRKKSTSPSAKK
jgi:hypothetical protein